MGFDFEELAGRGAVGGLFINTVIVKQNQEVMRFISQQIGWLWTVGQENIRDFSSNGRALKLLYCFIFLITDFSTSHFYLYFIYLG